MGLYTITVCNTVMWRCLIHSFCHRYRMTTDSETRGQWAASSFSTHIHIYMLMASECVDEISHRISWTIKWQITDSFHGRRRHPRPFVRCKDKSFLSWKYIITPNTLLYMFALWIVLYCVGFSYLFVHKVTSYSVLSSLLCILYM